MCLQTGGALSNSRLSERLPAGLFALLEAAFFNPEKHQHRLWLTLTSGALHNVFVWRDQWEKTLWKQANHRNQLVLMFSGSFLTWLLPQFTATLDRFEFGIFYVWPVFIQMLNLSRVNINMRRIEKTTSPHLWTLCLFQWASERLWTLHGFILWHRQRGNGKVWRFAAEAKVNVCVFIRGGERRPSSLQCLSLWLSFFLVHASPFLISLHREVKQQLKPILGLRCTLTSAVK